MIEIDVEPALKHCRECDVIVPYYFGKNLDRDTTFTYDISSHSTTVISTNGFKFTKTLVFSNEKYDHIKVGTCLVKGAYYKGEMYCLACLNKKHK